MNKTDLLCFCGALVPALALISPREFSNDFSGKWVLKASQTKMPHQPCENKCALYSAVFISLYNGNVEGNARWRHWPLPCAAPAAQFTISVTFPFPALLTAPCLWSIANDKTHLQEINYILPLPFPPCQLWRTILFAQGVHCGEGWGDGGEGRRGFCGRHTIRYSLAC